MPASSRDGMDLPTPERTSQQPEDLMSPDVAEGNAGREVAEEPFLAFGIPEPVTNASPHRSGLGAAADGSIGPGGYRPWVDLLHIEQRHVVPLNHMEHPPAEGLVTLPARRRQEQVRMAGHASSVVVAADEFKAVVWEEILCRERMRAACNPDPSPRKALYVIAGNPGRSFLITKPPIVRVKLAGCAVETARECPVEIDVLVGVQAYHVDCGERE